MGKRKKLSSSEDDDIDDRYQPSNASSEEASEGGFNSYSSRPKSKKRRAPKKAIPTKKTSKHNTYRSKRLPSISDDDTDDIDDSGYDHQEQRTTAKQRNNSADSSPHQIVIGLSPGKSRAYIARQKGITVEELEAQQCVKSKPKPTKKPVARTSKAASSKPARTKEKALAAPVKPKRRKRSTKQARPSDDDDDDEAASDDMFVPKPVSKRHQHSSSSDSDDVRPGIQGKLRRNLTPPAKTRLIAEVTDDDDDSSKNNNIGTSLEEEEDIPPPKSSQIRKRIPKIVLDDSDDEKKDEDTDEPVIISSSRAKRKKPRRIVSDEEDDIESSDSITFTSKTVKDKKKAPPTLIADSSDDFTPIKMSSRRERVRNKLASSQSFKEWKTDKANKTMRKVDSDDDNDYNGSSEEDVVTKKKKPVKRTPSVPRAPLTKATRFVYEGNSYRRWERTMLLIGWRFFLTQSKTSERQDETYANDEDDEFIDEEEDVEDNNSDLESPSPEPKPRKKKHKKRRSTIEEDWEVQADAEDLKLSTEASNDVEPESEDQTSRRSKRRRNSKPSFVKRVLGKVESSDDIEDGDQENDKDSSEAESLESISRYELEFEAQNQDDEFAVSDNEIGREGTELFSCICGVAASYDDFKGLKMVCNRCRKKQHAGCFGFTNKEDIKKWICHECDPEKEALNIPLREAAHLRTLVQEAGLEDQAVNYLDSLADVNVPHCEDFLCYPIHYACQYGMADLLKALLDKGARPNVVDTKIRTPLHYAVAYDQPDIVEILLNTKQTKAFREIWLTTVDIGGLTPIGIACLSESRVEILKLLLKNAKKLDAEFPYTPACNYNLLHIAAARGNADAIPELLRAGFNPTDQDTNGRTAFHMACRSVTRGAGIFASETLKNLIKWISDSAHERLGVLDDRDDFGNTALLYASGCDEAEEAESGQVWIDSEKDLEFSPNTVDDSAWDQAASSMVHQLLDAGAKTDPVSIADENGRSSLHYAAVSGLPNTVLTLIEAGFKADVLDNEGFSPLLYAFFREQARKGVLSPHKPRLQYEESDSDDDSGRSNPYQVHDLELDNADDNTPSLPDEEGGSVDEDIIVRLLRASPYQLSHMSTLLASSATRPLVGKLIRSLATKPSAFVFLNTFITTNICRLHSNDLKWLLSIPGLISLENKRLYIQHRLSLLKPFSASISNVKRGINLMTSACDFAAYDSPRADSPYYGALKWGSCRPELSIQFAGEDGIGPGVTREFYDTLAPLFLDERLGLFSRDGKGLAFFSPDVVKSKVDGLATLPVTELAKRVGRMMGIMFITPKVELGLTGRCLSPAIYKTILNKEVTSADWELIDITFWKSINFILEEADDALLSEMTFETDEVDAFGKRHTVELVRGGANKTVNHMNKQGYIDLRINRKRDICKRKAYAFREGFTSVVPRDILDLLQPSELEIMMSGNATIDIEDWKANTRYELFTAIHSEIKRWFWTIVDELSQDERSLLLKFATGSSRPPASVAQMESMGGDSGFVIMLLVHEKGNKLPTASTCFNTLKIPAYTSLAQFREKLLIAIRHGSTGFAFA
ncbi:hypothetical protein SmJEL517_g06073 [Synchytrium microbalum]|uniref:E3 ubiquitin-protein ligase HACE1 n=1 Tax=Synchytrium microbalum TaxID=1806994 RepID=A0A507BHL8_9FUNG|nr:uncharacterized protein SmJEL517_g06073 [Synchytrium microbalum]TPX30350.1 hypothetical protein SmJEL517_g06073 [Synchytrium microbalum]